MSIQSIQLEALMKKAVSGDSRSYNEALKRIASILRCYVAKRINSPQEVDDVLQEILISIHKAWHTYDGERPIMPWIYSIAKFRIIDHLRKIYGSAKSITLDDLPEIEDENVTNSQSFYESIEKEIESLPGKQPAILKLMHFEGYTSREAAERLGMNESAVRVAAFRAYKLLRKKLS
jgi:RNA polymerase sigma-70 factor (ECF subfamily)